MPPHLRPQYMYLALDRRRTMCLASLLALERLAGLADGHAHGHAARGHAAHRLVHRAALVQLALDVHQPPQHEPEEERGAADQRVALLLIRLRVRIRIEARPRLRLRLRLGERWDEGLCQGWDPGWGQGQGTLASTAGPCAPAGTCPAWPRS